MVHIDRLKDSSGTILTQGVNLTVCREKNRCLQNNEFDFIANQGEFVILHQTAIGKMVFFFYIKICTCVKVMTYVPEPCECMTSP